MKVLIILLAVHLGFSLACICVSLTIVWIFLDEAQEKVPIESKYTFFEFVKFLVSFFIPGKNIMMAIVFSVSPFMTMEELKKKLDRKK